MSATWKTVYEGQHEKRAVKVSESNDHTYRVLTIQTEHDEGIAYQEGNRYVHVSPASKGEQVESEVDSIDSLEEALKELHFSADTVKAIIGKIR